MTAQETALRHQQILRRILTTLQVDSGLADHVGKLSVQYAGGGIVVEGNLPSHHLRGRIVPMIRRAGVLSQVDNRVAVG